MHSRSLGTSIHGRYAHCAEQKRHYLLSMLGQHVNLASLTLSACCVHSYLHLQLHLQVCQTHIFSRIVSMGMQTKVLVIEQAPCCVHLTESVCRDA